MKPATLAIHAGQEPDAVTGAVISPIYMTSTFEQESPGVTKDGYDYTRAGNPNFTQLETVLAALEKGKYATIFSSGLGALSALVSTLKMGDSVIALQGLYGGTYRLFNQVFDKFGINFAQVSAQDLEAALKFKPHYLIFETPTNPLLQVYDIAHFAQLAHQNGVKVLVDNTFATPVNQNPLLLGADVVWHSTTKYLGGHSDVIGGALITHSEELKKAFDFARMALGLNPSPFDAWLTHRGVKTLFVRMKAHNENGKIVADWLAKHPLVKKVYYPGYSGMVSVEFNLSLVQIQQLIASLQLFTLAESLGGVESLVCHPATMTHLSVPAALRHQCGLSDSLIRLSVGIEDPQDLINDLQKALK